MKVIAPQGTRAPREDNPREYIGDDVPAEMPDSTYYRRLIADGSLILAESAPASSKPSKTPIKDPLGASKAEDSKKGGKE